jgi:uncharacterized membrane-anchored protein
MTKQTLLNALRKVPEITIYFWIIKILTTAMGESLSDYFITKIDPVLAVGVSGVCLVTALVIQFRAKTYIAWKYWLVVSLVAVCGTMVADVMHVVMGVSYLASTIMFIIALTAVFYLWNSKERTLSIHSITTKRRELFYWLAVMTTFALGTAAGDMTAGTLHLGYLVSGLLFAVMIALPATIYAITKTHEVIWFWAAYILTRPFGASFADWFGKSHAVSGLGLGDGIVSGVLAVLIILFVTYVSFNRREVALEHGR